MRYDNILISRISFAALKDIELMSIEVMYRNNIISSSLYWALIKNNILDFKGLKSHYEESGTFRDLTKISSKLNVEAIALLNVPQEGHVEKQPEDFMTKNQLFSITDLIDRWVYLKMLELRGEDLNRAAAKHLKSLEETQKDDHDFKMALSSIFRDPLKIKGVGVIKSPDIKRILHDIREISNDREKLDKFKKEFLLSRLGLLTGLKPEVFTSSNIYLDSLPGIIQFVLDNSSRLKDTDHYLMENFHGFKLWNAGNELSYRDIAEKILEEEGREVSDSMLRVRLNRLKKNLRNIIDAVIEETGKLNITDHEEFRLTGDFIIFPSQDIDHLNEKYSLEFSILMYDLIISSVNRGYLSLFQESNQGFTELAYIKDELVSENKEFRKMLLLLREDLNRDSPNGIQRVFEFYKTECIDSDNRIQFISDLLRAHNDSIAISGDIIEFPPTRAWKLSLGDYAADILKVNGEAMRYDRIVEKFNEEHPEIKLNSYRAMKDAMYVSGRIISLGGRTNFYILREWEESYFHGPYKELIIKYLEDKQAPCHYYEIFRDICNGRPEMRWKHIYDTAIGMADVFTHHGGGFYSLKRRKLPSAREYSKLYAAVYVYIRNNKELLDEPETLLSVLKQRYPELEEIQLEFAIFVESSEMEKD